MSLFSLPGVMGRKSVPSDGSDAAGAVRPSVVSSADLNKQLVEEAGAVDQHLFFGPQLAVFEGERTRVIHGERKIVKNNKRFWLASEPLSMDRDSTTSLVGFPAAEPVNKGLSSKVSAATRFLGQKVAALKFPPTHVNEDSFCDGCGMDPIVGNMYSCSRCPNFSLCEGCYQTGIHGYEESKLLRDVREDFALRRITEKCKRKVPEEVFHVLLKTVCRGQVDKFNFLATWICAVVLNSPINELAVRGIEVPHLENETRATLVKLLTPVLAERTDLEVCMEWFCPDADNESLPGSRRRLETLRIWVATDKDSKSPFTSKQQADDETESDLSPRSNGDMIPSPGPASPYMSPAGDSPTSTPPPSPSHADKRSHSTASSSSSVSSSAQATGFDAMSLADKLAASQLSQENEEDEAYASDSVSSDITPQRVDGVSVAGGFAM